MANNVPLVSAYKTNFITRRLIQTFFGGLRFDTPAPATSDTLSIGKQTSVNAISILDDEEQTVPLTFSRLIAQLIAFSWPIAIAATVTTLSVLYWPNNPKVGAGLGALMAFLIMVSIHGLLKLKSNRVVLPVSDGNHKPVFNNKLLSQVFPIAHRKSPLTILLHSCISAFMIGGAVEYLQPKPNHWDISSSSLLILGWFSVTLAQYSLTVQPPPEPATYDAAELTQPTGLSPLNRPVHIIVIFIIHIFIDIYSTDSQLAHNSLLIILAMFPVLWFFGFLPPIDALIHWSLERINLIFFGGGSKTSIFSLLVSILLSLFIIGICYHVEKQLPDVSFTFSLFIFASFAVLLGFNLSLIVPSDFKKYNLKRYFGVSIGLLVLNLTSVAIGLQLTKSKVLQSLLVYLIVIILLVIFLTRYFTKLYIFGDLIRNPIYPFMNDKDSFFKYQKFIKYFQIFTNALTKFVLLFILTLYITSLFGASTSISITPLNTTNGINNRNENNNSNVLHDIMKDSSFLLTMSTFRVYRRGIVNPFVTGWVVFFAHVLPDYCFYIFDSNLPFQLRYFVIDFVITVLDGFFKRLYLVLVISGSSIFLEKQKTANTTGLNVFQALIFTIILVIILAASVLSFPPLPLFTLPLFLPSFPRPVQFWPRVRKNDVDTLDSCYYRQITSKFIDAIESKCLRIANASAGNYFLARFGGDRMMFIQVLESDFGYSKIKIKGLELQETSCHALEATELDDFVENAFFNKNELWQYLNINFAATMQPVDVVFADSYSNAKSVLTGVIDSPEFPTIIKQLLPLIFVWTLCKHHVKDILNKKLNTSSLEESFDEKILNTRKDTFTVKLPPITKPSNPSENKLFEHVNKLSEVDIGPDLKSLPTDMMKELCNTDWSDDDEDLLGPETSARSRPTTNSQSASNSLALPEKYDSLRKSIDLTESPRFNNYLSESAVSIPMNDFSKTSNSAISHQEWSNVGDNQYAKSIDRNSGRQTLSFPPQLLLNCYNYLSRGTVNHEADRYLPGNDWLHLVVRTIFGEDLPIITDDDLVSFFSSVKTIYRVCYSCLVPSSASGFGSPLTDLTPLIIYELFQELQLRDERKMTFFRNNLSLALITTKSFRYAVKIALDQLIIGGGERFTDAELLEQLKDFDDNWHFGSDSVDEWSQAVFSETPQLFSIGRDNVKETYTSHLLTFQKIPIYIFELNSSVVEGIWSSLSFELLYLTNDDDERYSIQAHPLILRNLTVQAADIPLGYPIFVSEHLISDINLFK